MSAELVDTNVLIYAHDPTTPAKHLAARRLMERLWIEETGVLSVQVLQEFVWIATRKLPQPLTMPAALEIVEDLAVWPVFAPGAADVLAAGRLAESARISFWDAMVVHAAASLGASVLWTEDLNPGQTIEGVEIRTPFPPTTA